MPKVKIEALRRKVTTPQETVEVLIKNDPVECSDVTSVIEIGTTLQRWWYGWNWWVTLKWWKLKVQFLRPMVISAISR